MKKIIKLTESDLTRIVKRVIMESVVNLQVGSKISEITNRLYIIGRGYRFADLMRNKTENRFEITNATVTSKTPNGYIVKVSYLFYDPENERKDGEKNVYKTLNDVCLRIDNKDIIEYSDGILQLAWSNEFVEGRITECNEKKPEDKKDTDVDYKKVFKTFDDVRKFQKWVLSVKNDKTILGPSGVDGDWGPATKMAWDKYGSEYVKTLVPKTDDYKKCFVGMVYEPVADFGYKKFPENYSKENSEGTFIYYKGTNWSSGTGRLISGKGLGEKTFNWACSQSKLTTTNMSKDWKKIMPY